MKSVLITIGVLGVAILGFVLYLFVSSLLDTTQPAPAVANSNPQNFPATQAIPVITPAATNSTTDPDARPSQAPAPTPLMDDKTVAVLKETAPLVTAGKLDEALAIINPAVEASPNDPMLYSARGFIYAQKQNFDLERQDLNKAIELGDKSAFIKFDLAEIDFVQKNYDLARPEFMALEGDSEWGDLATYKAFLCDLLAGHDEQSARELNAFNLSGSNASYYFANIASDLYHHKPEEARSFFDSATRIYTPTKVEIYSTSLKNLGYLPLPPPPTH